ncbi:uncharacterized protein LOC126554633 [Aphis gossypii]|uniref:uncharacterized protein LOC126554633 n=1 Tax=Aphis gossypii TaxID=80765 RepID=UPI0021591549|nr:uncharacterized protein LOC126554633 [Aphis gossypii]
MATFNLQIDIDGCLLGYKRLLFDLEKNALDYIQQAAGTNDCISTIIEFLTNCVEQGIVQMNVEELKNKGVQITVSIPKRSIIFSTSVKPINVQNIKNNPCRETIDWDNISSHSENEEVDQPSKITSDADANAKTTIEECSDETSFKNQGERETTHQSIFTEGMTKFMLEKYGKFMNFVGPMRKFKKKMDMWKQIAKDMEEEVGVKFTHVQIENRYKTISKRKKIIVDNNRSTGAARMDDEYENEWKQITNKDDSIIPEVMRSTKVVVINKKDYTQPKLKKIKTDSTQTMLLKFLKEKEESKERRHQEKMELIRSLLNK